MSVIKKISFGNGQFNQFKFSQNSNVSSPIQSQTTPVVPAVDEGKTKTAKTLNYVSAATALASLGVAGVAIFKATKNPKSAEAVTKDFVQDLVKPLNKSIEGLTGKLQKATDDITGMNNKLTGEVSRLNASVQQVAQDANTKITGVQNELAGKINFASGMSSKSVENFFTRDVNVNGMQIRLANVLNEVSGDSLAKMEEELQTESAKRILGIIEKTDRKPSDNLFIRIPTAEIRPFSSTGGMSVVPKELIANLAAMMNTKQKANLLLDTPLYIGNAGSKMYYKKVAEFDKGEPTGRFHYIKKYWHADEKKFKEDNLATLTKIDTMRLPIYTDKTKSIEEVNVYLSNELNSVVDFKLLAPRLEPEVLKDIENTVNAGKVWQNDMLQIKKNPNTGEYEAKAKYKTVFYESPKFEMSGPITSGRLNIYKDDAIETGETERFIYFAKFFTEHMMNNESAKVKLGADMIIGNDWQCGPISAMLRQLTTVRKYYGMDPEKAQQLHNTPIATILHNVALPGAAWHSQAKLLNIMFGEHAAKIVENSHMPNSFIKNKTPGLSQDMWNGLLKGEGVNPLGMAAAYSDMLIPVSTKYGEEIAEHAEFGGIGHEVYKLRARAGEFSNTKLLQNIAINNGLEPEKLSTSPTIKGITNGCDPVNNTLTSKKARGLEDKLKLENNSVWTLKDADNDIVKWHKHNKEVYLKKVQSDIERARKSSDPEDNVMKLWMKDETDLTGVTVDTPIFSSAGRLTEQKGLDLFAEGIKDFYKDFKGKDYPVFYIQGAGELKYVEPLFKLKAELAKTNPIAAKRIVLANLFSEPGRYDGCKLFSDFTVMSSWFEPCGLVHKENATYSGAIPLVFDVGGLASGLTNKVNAVIAKFSPRYTGNAVAKNGESLAKGIKECCELMSNGTEFAKVLEASQKADHSWLQSDGAMDQYGKMLVDMKILKPECLEFPGKVS